jgi:hypothetical protein
MCLPTRTDHPGPLGVHNRSCLVGGPVRAQGRRALHHLAQVRNEPRHLRALRIRGRQHAPQPARAQQRQRRRHVRPRRRLPRRHRLLRPPLLMYGVLSMI